MLKFIPPCQRASMLSKTIKEKNTSLSHADVLRYDQFFKIHVHVLRSQGFPTSSGSVKNNEHWNNTSGLKWSDLFAKIKVLFNVHSNTYEWFVVSLDLLKLRLSTYSSALCTHFFTDSRCVSDNHLPLSRLLLCFVYIFFRRWQRRRGTSRRRCGSLSTPSSATSTSSLS